MNLPKIGGIVNAEAMAIMSLKKNRFNADHGNLLGYPWPNFWVKALSLRRERVVFTANTASNFEMAGSSHGMT